MVRHSLVQVALAAMVAISISTTIMAGWNWPTCLATSNQKNASVTESEWSIGLAHNNASCVISPDPCLNQCRKLFVAGEQPKSKVPSRTWASCNCNCLFCNQTVAHATDRENKSYILECPWSTFAIDTLLASLNDSACDAAREAEFIPNRVWLNYRLADSFMGKWNMNTSNWATTKSRYRGSLEDVYRQNAVQHHLTFGNFTVMYQMVKDRLAKLPPSVLPRPNTLVVHLRLGDVVDYSVESVTNMMLEQTYYLHWAKSGKMIGPRNIGTKLYNPAIVDWNAYVKPLSYYYVNVVQPAREKKYQHVVLMGGIHRRQVVDTTGSKTCQYTKTLQLYLSRMLPHVNVSLRLGHSPDDDVLFATSADHFLVSGGGFSRIMETLQQMRAEELAQKS